MMIKRMFLATLCMLTIATGAFAEKLTKTPINLEFYGGIKTTYKQQSNFRASLLDSKDRLAAAGISDMGIDSRHGANNRASQTTRVSGSLTGIAKAGEHEYEGSKWYNLIGVMQISLSPKDPDSNLSGNKDGGMVDVIDTGDVWIRYSPFVALGIKVGVQTIAATAPADAIGHVYAGDRDSDFSFYTVSILYEQPGISADFHLSKDIEFGVGLIQGMGDFSEIITAGSSSQANNNVAWASAKFGFIDATIGFQDISVGGKETDSATGIPDEWQHEYKHMIMNYTLKGNIAGFSPYYSIQTAQGDAVSVNGWETVNKTLSSAGLSTLKNSNGDRNVEGTFTSIGLIGKLGSMGSFAIDYTTLSTPSWGESGNIALGTEFDNVVQVNYEYPITEGCKITLFYNSLSAKVDSVLRSDIQTMKNNVVTSSKLGVDSATLTQLKALDALLDATVLTSTQSVGIELSMTFGN